MPIGILPVPAMRRSVSSRAATKQRLGGFGHQGGWRVVRGGFAQALEGDRIRHGQAALDEMKDNLRNPAFDERDDERSRPIEAATRALQSTPRPVGKRGAAVPLHRGWGEARARQGPGNRLPQPVQTAVSPGPERPTIPAPRSRKSAPGTWMTSPLLRDGDRRCRHQPEQARRVFAADCVAAGGARRRLAVQRLPDRPCAAVIPAQD
jgi:hypothetical protein